MRFVCWSTKPVRTKFHFGWMGRKWAINGTLTSDFIERFEDSGVHLTQTLLTQNIGHSTNMGPKNCFPSVCWLTQKFSGNGAALTVHTTQEIQFNGESIFQLFPLNIWHQALNLSPPSTHTLPKKGLVKLGNPSWLAFPKICWTPVKKLCLTWSLCILSEGPS